MLSGGESGMLSGGKISTHSSLQGGVLVQRQIN
jgi:hypothetical protein